MEKGFDIRSPCGLKWSYILLVCFIAIIIAIILGFYIGFQYGQSAYMDILTSNNIYCMNSSNSVFSQIGIDYMNKSLLPQIGVN